MLESGHLLEKVQTLPQSYFTLLMDQQLLLLYSNPHCLIVL